MSVDGQWFASGVAADPCDLPTSLIEVLEEGDAGHQRVSRAGKPRLVVGVPLAERNAQYLEIVSLDNLRANAPDVDDLAADRFGADDASRAPLIGVYASRRLLRPLQRMSVVAAGITAGDLHARLDAQGDRDLETLVDSFNEMVGALQERIEREQRFTSDVSHELRTPLTVLKAAIQLVEQRSPDLSPARCRRSRCWPTGELLRTTRPRSARDLALRCRRRARRAGGDRPRCVSRQRVARSRRPARHERDRRRRFESGVDRRRMERILGNLIENAERYAGGVTTITVSRNNGLGRDRRRPIAGIGIPVDEREHVFERFWRGRDARHQASKGSGLGLALVAEHVRLLNGTIRVDDAPSGGAKFVVDLPVEREWRRNDTDGTVTRMTRMRPIVRRRLRVVLAFGALAVTVVGCTVPGEDSATRIPPDEVPFQLLDQTTTSTTILDASTTSAPDDSVVVYFVRDGRLAPVTRESTAADPTGVLARLVEGPSESEPDQGCGRRWCQSSPRSWRSTVTWSRSTSTRSSARSRPPNNGWHWRRSRSRWRSCRPSTRSDSSSPARPRACREATVRRPIGP